MTQAVPGLYLTFKRGADTPRVGLFAGRKGLVSLPANGRKNRICGPLAAKRVRNRGLEVSGLSRAARNPGRLDTKMRCGALGLRGPVSAQLNPKCGFATMMGLSRLPFWDCCSRAQRGGEEFL